MREVYIWIFLFLSLASNNLCQRIDCNWGAEWLCGDRCLNEGNSCMCGNQTITFADATNYNCCNEGTCFKEMNGNVKCHGLKQDWRLPCHGICKQSAIYGLTTLACADQNQCVKAIALCRGVPICRE